MWNEVWVRVSPHSKLELFTSSARGTSLSSLTIEIGSTAA